MNDLRRRSPDPQRLRPLDLILISLLDHVGLLLNQPNIDGLIG